MSDKKDVGRINLYVPLETRRRIRVWCARRGTTMQGALAEMLIKAFEKVDVSGGEPR